MPAPRDTQCQQLRTQIARSRRRLDRHARQLVTDARRGLSLERLITPGGGWSWLLILGASLALARWGLGNRPLEDWRNRLLGSTVSSWLERWARRLRVMAWRYRRSARPAATEANHD